MKAKPGCDYKWFPRPHPHLDSIVKGKPGSDLKLKANPGSDYKWFPRPQDSKEKGYKMQAGSDRKWEAIKLPFRIKYSFNCRGINVIFFFFDFLNPCLFSV